MAKLLRVEREEMRRRAAAGIVGFSERGEAVAAAVEQVEWRGENSEESSKSPLRKRGRNDRLEGCH